MSLYFFLISNMRRREWNTRRREDEIVNKMLLQYTIFIHVYKSVTHHNHIIKTPMFTSPWLKNTEEDRRTKQLVCDQCYTRALFLTWMWHNTQNNKISLQARATRIQKRQDCTMIQHTKYQKPVPQEYRKDDYTMIQHTKQQDKKQRNSPAKTKGERENVDLISITFNSIPVFCTKHWPHLHHHCIFYLQNPNKSQRE